MGTLSTLVVRPMTRDDLPAVANLELANQPSPWSLSVFEDELKAPSRVYLVAGDPSLVGFGGIMLVSDEAHVTNLLVDPRRRRSGIGRVLLSRLTSEAISQGARHLTLEVRATNAAARRLYTSFGMAPVGVRPNYYGDEDALIFWAHDIDDPAFQEQLA